MEKKEERESFFTVGRNVLVTSDNHAIEINIHLIIVPVGWPF